MATANETMDAPTRRRPMSAERKFFTAMAFAVLVSTFIGFMPSYFLRGLTTPYSR